MKLMQFPFELPNLALPKVLKANLVDKNTIEAQRAYKTSKPPKLNKLALLNYSASALLVTLTCAMPIKVFANESLPIDEPAVSLPDPIVLKQMQQVRGPYATQVVNGKTVNTLQETAKISKCDSEGCEYAKQTVLVKLAANSTSSSIQARPSGSIDLLLGATAKQVFPNAKAPAKGAMLRTAQGSTIPEPDLTKWYELELDSNMTVEQALTQLEADSRVEKAEANFVRKLGLVETNSANTLAAASESNDPKITDQWYLTDAKVPQAWQWLAEHDLPEGGNRNIVVAVIDSGVDYTHEDLSLNMWKNAGEIPNNGLDDDNNGFIDDIHGVTVVGESFSHSGDPMDDNGHGTHVAGIIAAKANNNKGIKGVAHNVQIMAIKAGQYSGVLTSADIAEGVWYASQMGADIINMSFGGNGRSALEEEALAVAFGTSVLIASAGNDGLPNEKSCLPKFAANYPASYNWVLGVMAKAPQPDKNGDYLASFSSWDCKAETRFEYEVMAPGVDILSTLPNNAYGAWDGTSMAAPIVAGMAALLRTRFAEKSAYSSRFIMGQLARTGDLMQGKTYSNDTPPIFYFSANAEQALINTPQPRLSYLEHYLWDETSQSTANDDDGIVDAGETIDLAIIVRNQWGQANNVQVTISTAGDDPYIEFITDTVNYGSVGTFSNDDNGLIYSAEGLVTGVNKPFSFKVADNTPNNHIIPLVVTFTAENGLDPEDTTNYSFISKFSLIVHRGKELPSVLDGDKPGTPAGNLDTDGIEDGVITLDGASLYIIDKPVLIEKGVTLKLIDGAQVQFWGSQPDDTYAVFRNAYLQVEGSLIVQGSVENPVQLRPSALFPNRMVVLKSVNAELFDIRYADITNLYREADNEEIATFDHLVLRRGLENSWLFKSKRSSSDWEYVSSTNLGNGQVRFTNSIFKGLGGAEINYKESDSRAGEGYEFSIRYGDFDLQTVLFDNTWMSNGSFSDTHAVGLTMADSDNVYLGNTKKQQNGTIAASKLLIPAKIIKTYVSEPFSYNGKTYYRINLGGSTWQQTQAFLDTLNVEAYMAVLSDESEKEALFAWLVTLTAETQAGYMHSRFGYVKQDDGSWGWYNNQSGINLDNDYSWTNRENKNIEYLTVYNASWNNYSYIPQNNQETSYSIIELTSDIGQANLKAALENYAAAQYSIDNQFNNNAILNRYWDANPDHWLQISTWKPDEYQDENTVNIFEDFRNNYWGTNSKTLIDYVVNDYNDDFNLNKALIEPYLTVPAETTYPFVWKVELLDAEGNDRADGRFGSETMTWKITFNRDMEQTVQPSVTFGPEEPYTDFAVQGDWINARTWQGQVRISPIASDGYQYVRVQGAVAADDAWLVTGNDYARFRFEVISSGTESLNLQAVGGDGYVDLSWSQDDFELLHGFNIYRSTQADSGFIRIHQALIGNDIREFRDENVEPGVTYYYHFKVVTELGESDPSNTDSATPTDTIKPEVSHSEITQATWGSNVLVQATVTDNIAVETVTLYYRVKGSTDYTPLVMSSSAANVYRVTIPADAVVSPGIEYYILASDGYSTSTSGRADTPNAVFVDDNPVVVSLSPAQGSAAGGDTVTISGANFKEGLTIQFGDVNCTSVTVVNSNEASCVTPVHFPGVTSVTAKNTDGKNSKLQSGFTFVGDTVSLGIANVKGAKGQLLLVPINVSDANGIASIQTQLTFNPQHLTFNAVVKSNLSSAWAFETNLTAAGQVNIAGAATTPISGSGALFYAEFIVAVANEASSQISLNNTNLNDNTIKAEVFAGQFSYFPGHDLSGGVYYWDDANNPVTANLSLDGQFITSSANGKFALTAISESAHSLKVEKNATSSNAITAYDASLVLKHAVDASLLTGAAFTAGDVNHSGAVSALDAFEILNYAAGLRSLPFNNSTAAWKFEPEVKVYEPLNATLTEQNFSAILIGDASGNWTEQTDAAQGGIGDNSHSNSLLVTADFGFVNQRLDANNNVLVDLYLDTKGAAVSALEFNLVIPENVTLIANQSLELVKNWSIVVNDDDAKLIKVAMASASDILQSGSVLTLTFAPAQTDALLDLTAVLVNETPTTTQAMQYGAFESDVDNDGVIDILDSFPLNPLEAYDFDNDTVGNNADLDDDNDGVLDSEDAFPFDPSETTDTDGDGYGDNRDVFPNDKAEWLDTDGDGEGDNSDPDADGDGKVDFTLDINGDGKVSLPSDGFIILRHMVGFPAQALATDADMASATRTKDEMKTLLDSAKASGLLDINGDGKVSLPSDGFIILRHMVGFPAQALATEADMVNATRTKEEMKAFLQSL